MIQNLALLDKVTWYSHLEDESVLSKRGIRFGFHGKGMESFPCHHAKQVHGVSIVEADPTTAPEGAARPLADAIYTQTRGLVIGVQTADCLPVLFTSERGTAVMALHAGWKGLTSGIIANGVETMRKLCPNEAIFASIGPAIAHCHYEVGPELVEAIQGAALGLSSEQTAFCLSRGAKDRWFLDLPTAGTFALLNSGVAPKHISVFRSCTYCFPLKWHSFRRDASASQRNWAWIMLPSE